MDALRILSIGAGAIGTYIGGSLALKGHQVVFVERPQVVEGLKSRGLRLTFGDTEYHLPDPQVVPSMEAALSLGDFDIAIFALKSYDTQAFIDGLPKPYSALPTILCFSNGVDNEPTLTKALGPEKVIAGTVTSSVARRAAGDVVMERQRGLGVAAGHPLSERVVAALNAANLNAQLFPKAADMKWSKMLTNLMGNATSAILDLTPGEVFSQPQLFRLEIALLREALDVMRAQNIHPVDIPGVPVRLLAFVVRYLPLGLSRPVLQKAVGGGRGGKMPSFHIDLHAGHGKSEVDYLNGAVVRAGEQVGIPTPVNRMLTETLLQLTRGEIPLERFAHQPEQLLNLLEN